MLVVLRVNELPPFSWGIFICGNRCLISVMVLRLTLMGLLVLAYTAGSTQTLGGSSAFNFLRLQLHPQAGALGGRNVSHFVADLGMLSENPSLLRKDHHAAISANFTSLAPTITGLYATGAYHLEKAATTFALGITHLGYGEQPETDPSGNTLGTFRAFDQLLGFAISRKYNKKWHYGSTLKLINSRYGAYASQALALDMGLNYYDEEQMIQFGFAAKNMGVQTKAYANSKEDLPFDLVLGMTKQLEKAPIRFSLTGQRMHQFDLLYNDTLFNETNFGRQPKVNLGTKIFSHLVLGADILVGEKIVLTGGYNVLRRRELRIQNIASGLTGFSYGFNLHLQRLRMYYARTHYQSSLSHHQISFSFKLNPAEN